MIPRAESVTKSLVPQHLFIVSRQQPDLFSYLTREFSAEPDVTIIVDRRQGERRAQRAETNGVMSTNGATDTTNRRQSDRRLKAELESNLSTLGYAFVRIA